MVPPDLLNLLEDSVRRSVLADSLEETATLLDDYLKEVERRLRGAPTDLPSLEDRARKLFEWTNQLVLASREETLASVAHLRTLSGYWSVPDVHSHVCTRA
jgi:ABC-type transporter Mla subunit MlaD